ncbi:MAG TPA: EamA family transporter [Candidatus Angelobacter sp.]
MSTRSMVEEPELLMERTQLATPSALWKWAALGAIVLGSLGHLLIKTGVTAAARQTINSSLLGRLSHYLLQPAAMTGLLIYGVGTLLWIYAVSQRNISFLYPLTALTYVIVALGGKFIFGEMISPQRWLGIGVVMLGVAMMQLSAREQKA